MGNRWFQKYCGLRGHAQALSKRGDPLLPWFLGFWPCLCKVGVGQRCIRPADNRRRRDPPSPLIPTKAKQNTSGCPRAPFNNSAPLGVGAPRYFFVAHIVTLCYNMGQVGGGKGQPTPLISIPGPATDGETGTVGRHSGSVDLGGWREVD